MEFAFPSFTRASTDLPYEQTPQKSLLELVIEAKGRLGLVPQRKQEKRNAAASFSAFSDSDEEDGDGEGSGEAADTTSVLTTRTAWVPQTHLLDYFFSGPFMHAFLTLHNISSSRAAAMLAPPLLSVRDMHLHPVVEAALCFALQDAINAQHPRGSSGGNGGGGGAHQRGSRGGRGGRGGRGRGDASRWGDARGGDERYRASASTGAPAFPLWEVAKLEQLKNAVFGEGAEVPDVHGRPSYAEGGSLLAEDALAARHGAASQQQQQLISDNVATSTSDVAQRTLFRGLQQVALPALLLGDHVVLSGPRGVGKRTAVLLAAAANILTFGTAATIAKGHGNDEDEERELGDAALHDEATGGAGSTNLESENAGTNANAAVDGEPKEDVASVDPSVKAEVKLEALGSIESHQDLPVDHKVAADSSSGDIHNDGQPRSTTPRALIVVSSYADVCATAQWLERVFGPEAFMPYTFQKDGCALRPLVEESSSSSTATTNAATSTTDAAADAAAAATARMMVRGGNYTAAAGSSVLGSHAYLAPPTPVTPLPFITDTNMTSEAVLAEDPTQAGPVLSTNSGPDLSELAALVQDASLPVAVATVATSAEAGSTRDDRKRRRRSSPSRSGTEGESDASSDGERRGRRDRPSSSRYRSDDRRRHRSHRKRYDHGDEGEDDVRDNRKDRHSSSSGSRRHHRHHGSSSSGTHSVRVSSSSRHRHRRAMSEDDASDTDDGRRDRRRHHRSSRSRRDRRDGDDEEREHRREHRWHHGSSHDSSKRSHRHRSRYSDDDHDDDVNEDGRLPVERETVPLVEGSVEVAAAALSVLPPLVQPAEDASSHHGGASTADHASTEAAASGASTAEVAPLVHTMAAEPDPVMSDPNAWLPAVLRQRTPIVITTYHALQAAMEVVGGEASALPPLEDVRVAVLTHLERALLPPLKDTFSHGWWVTLVNALDVECQFMATADRSGGEVLGFLTSTIVPDAGEHLLHLEQRDASVWAMMDVRIYPVPVDVAASAVGDRGAATEGKAAGSRERRPKISGEDIDAAKLTHLFSLVTEHVADARQQEAQGRVDDPTAAGEVVASAAGGGRVVVVCSNKREQSLMLTQLNRLLRDQLEDGGAPGSGRCRLTDAVDVFRSGGADVLALTDAQLADARVVRDLHQCSSVDLIVHFSLPRNVMVQLEKAGIAEVLAQRGRAILGHSRPFSSRRWWHPVERDGAAGAEFEPVRVTCHVMLTEHNMKGRVGTCVTELLSEVGEQ